MDGKDDSWGGIGYEYGAARGVCDGSLRYPGLENGGMTVSWLIIELSITYSSNNSSIA